MLGDHSRPEFLTLEDGSHGYSQVGIEFSRPALVLMGLVAVVLLIACVNLATLLFLRGERRGGEMAIRAVLGAGRGQLIRQWLTESLLLAATGGLGGLLAAGWIDRLLLYFVAEPNRDSLRFHANAGVLAFTVALTVAACFLFGLPPAMRASRAAAEAALRSHAQSVLGRRGRAAQLTLAGQLAASLVLMAGALLFARTLWNLNGASGGFDRKTVVYGMPQFYRAQYPETRVPAAMKEILERLRNSPQFTSVTVGDPPILYGGSGGWGWIVVPGYTYAPFEDNVAFVSNVAPGYFRTLSIPLRAGRDFEERDRVDPARAVIVNERFAGHYFKGRNPLGQKFSFGNRPPLEIVGVVKNANVSSLREPPPDMVYQPIPANGFSTVVARVKPGADDSQCEAEIRSAVAAVAKNVPVLTGRLEQAVQDSLRRDRLVAELSAAFGLLGVLLASIGLYGAIAHSVSGRTREIGIRMALGAEPRDVMRMVFRQSLSITALGVLAGLPLAISGAKLVQPLLFGVSPADPLALAGSVAMLVAVALLAGLWPARRAARLDPTRALRYE
jgi:predicted permease